MHLQHGPPFGPGVAVSDADLSGRPEEIRDNTVDVKKGDCLDNSKTENLFSKMKKEMFYGHEKEFRSFAELKKAIDEYIIWYNNERIVTRLGGAPVCNRSIVPVSMLCYSSI